MALAGCVVYLELANRPTVALAALLYPLASRVFHRAMSSDADVEIFGQQRALAPSIKEPGEARALAARERIKEAGVATLPCDSDSQSV